jgi:exopolysaccharide biosynthesis polyprenyl glycosylphosphotransferase
VAVRRVTRQQIARRELYVGVLTAVIDLVAVVSGYLLARQLRTDNPVTPLNYGRAILTVPVWLATFAVYDLYDRRKIAAASTEARRLMHAAVVSVVAVVFVAFFLDLNISRTWLAFIAVSCSLFAGIGRVGMRQLVAVLHARGVLRTDSIVVGTNREGRTIARSLSRERSLGYNVIGFVDVNNTASTPEIDGRQVLGDISDIVDLVASNEIATVIVAGSALGNTELEELDRALQPLDVDVRVSPGLTHMAATRITVNAIDGVALLTLERNEFSRRQVAAKRAFDFVGALLISVVAMPLVLGIALAIRVTSGKQVIFTQERVGAAGKLYRMYKFRTMVRNAEALRTQLADGNQADGLLFKMREDPRVTWLGRKLRPLGLDELPQLLNVLKGEMSLVGPRPALQDEVEQYDDRLRERLRVKPGLTGLWQIKGRHELSFDDYARYDLFYVENWSLGLDLYVMASTLPALLRRRGSY